MRIAFVGTRGVPALYGGFETAVEEIGRRLVKRGHKVTVYCRNGYGDKSESTYEGIRKIYLPRLRLKIADTLSHTFVSLMHQFFYPSDVIIVMNAANGPLCVIPRLRGTPFAINVDGLEWMRGKWPLIGRKYFYLAAWFCTKISPTVNNTTDNIQQSYKALIADSSGIQEFYKETWNCDTYYAAYGTYIEQCTKPELLKKYDLLKEDYFLIVARLEPENNTDLIIKAFEELRTDKKLIIVGDGGYKSKYERKLKALTKGERVRFLGAIYEQEDLTEIMCNCFAYIHGHMVGGTNPILLKALGCGACVLYLDTGYRFNSRVAGNYGIPFPKTIEGLQGRMQYLLDHPKEVLKYRKHSPECIKEIYTWDKVTDGYENLCFNLCGLKQGSISS
ncbi:MAG TPA: glycosyltransferase [Planctomycetes bacterium]|nr:glycosyltransferase [Planctomycetota bacterium]